MFIVTISMMESSQIDCIEKFYCDSTRVNSFRW